MNERIDFPLATSTWGEDEIDAGIQVLRSGNTTMGDVTAEFEHEFSRKIGHEHSVMVNSGSSANLAAATALMLSLIDSRDPRRDVIVPAVSWSTSYFPLHQAGFNLVFVDVSSDTLNLTLESLVSFVTSDTVGVLAVNLLGNPCELDKIADFCGDHDLFLFEDNCESLGAEYKGKAAGTFGTVSTHSFFFSHHISTMEGGMVSTKDPSLLRQLRRVRAHGWTRGEDATVDSGFFGQYNFAVPGYNLRPTEVSAAIGRAQLLKLDNFLEQRKKNAVLFRELGQSVPWLQVQKETGKSSWFAFSLIIRECMDGLERKSIVAHLNKNGIETRPVVTGNFTRQPALKYLRHEIRGTLANADLIHERGFMVGNHHYSIEKELRHLFDRLQEIGA